MSTYAVYRIWAGVLTKDLPFDKNEHPFILKAISSFDGATKGGLKFAGIGMHGETVGFGVEIQKLDWVTEIGAPNTFNPVISEKAKKVLRQVNQIFKDLNISPTAKLYHHLDLGG